MNIILFDDHSHHRLKPLTYTRPVADLRIGILKISEKWEYRMKSRTSYLCMPYLQQKFAPYIEDDNLLISSAILPDDHLCEAIRQLSNQQVLTDMHGSPLAMHVPGHMLNTVSPNLYLKMVEELTQSLKTEVYRGQIDTLNRCTDIFAKNAGQLEMDFELLTRGKKSLSPEELGEGNRVIGQQFFAEPGAKANCAVFNTTTGPVYLAAESEVMEGSAVRGGLALNTGATLKMGAKIYGATTIGPHSKVGGEVNNCVIQGYSNKGHDGFIGNSVIGEWCNLGADTNTSNLKNNYGEVKTWDYESASLAPSGLQFVGLVMGDHSKCGINTMFNTGTTVGVFANIYGAGFPPKFIPSFAWGSHAPFETYNLEKAFEVARNVMGRRNVPFDETEKRLLEEVFELSAAFRR
jgi:UDP-N-acetylglucosamine diphosphorylase/glucosamine-1-phosphate N-acetyltransferase